MKIETITVSVDPRTGEPMVDKEFVHLRKHEKERVEWVASPPELDFVVSFDKPEGTPFDEKHFKPGRHQSNEIVVDDRDGEAKTFNYTVHFNNGKKKDPGIIIHNR